ncbi:MAG: hypothetical protein WBA57_16645 [Elainellaceae cyanobacterium]
MKSIPELSSVTLLKMHDFRLRILAIASSEKMCLNVGQHKTCNADI